MIEKTPSNLVPTLLRIVFAALFCAGFFFCSVRTVRSQTPVQDIIVTADSERTTEINGQSVQQLIHNVRFTQGGMTGTAENATHYLDQKHVELTGNVIIRQDTLTLMAPLVTWDEISRIGHAEHGVTLLDRDVKLTAESGDYDAFGQVAKFHKNVKVTQGTTKSAADELIYYRTTETSLATGHVKVTSDSGALSADRVLFARATDETTATGNVVLHNDSTWLSSDWFYNAKAQGITYARGHVTVQDPSSKTTLFGDSLARFAKSGYSIVPLNPLIMMIDSSIIRDSTSGRDTAIFDTTYIKAKTIEAYQSDSSKLIATDSVRMLRSNFSGTGGKLIYDQKNGSIALFKNKRQYLWYDSTQIAADSVSLTMKQRRIDRVYTFGHSFATEPLAELPNSGRIHQLEGERMVLIIQHDTIRSLYDISNALSIYFLMDNDKPNGVNRASGDTIRIDFKNKRVNRLAVLSGTEGEYWPERFVTGRAAAFRLGDYERNSLLRPKKEEFSPPWPVPEITMATKPKNNHP